MQALTAQQGFHLLRRAIEAGRKKPAIGVRGES